MKKVITAILAVIYLATSTGATLHLHYCMGELVSWSLEGKESKKCPGCGMPKKDTNAKGCCKDEQKFFKNNYDQKNTETGASPLTLFTAEVPASFCELNNPSFTDFIRIYYGNSPPRSSALPVYILNCVFRI